MISRIDIKGVHFDISDKLRKYTLKKLGGLDKHISRHARESAHLEVSMYEKKPAKGAVQCHCDIRLHLPHDNIVINESTVNMHAAVDIVTAKLKLQLKKYKDTHEQGKMHRRLFRGKRPVEIIET